MRKIVRKHKRGLRFAKPGFFSAASVAVLALVSSVSPTRAARTGNGPSLRFTGGATPAQDESGQTKLAQGEYVIYEQSNDGAVGPFPEEIYNFDETWTLSRDGRGGYQVRGVRKFQSLRGEPNTDPFVVDLSRDFTITRVEEATQLKWVKDSGPLTCDFLPTELSCSSGGSNPKDSIALHVPLENPYGLLWPISPFSLSGVTREVERDPMRSTRVDLLTIEQPSPANPIATTILEGPIRYLGQEDIAAAGKNWRAFKFSLKVPMHPEYLIWTSPQGFLLRVAIEHAHKNWQQEGMRLARFQSWNGF
jgi:hypothetical protein